MDSGDLLKFGFTVGCSVMAAGVAIHVFISKLKIDTAIMVRDIKDAVADISELSSVLKAANIEVMKSDISKLQKDNSDLNTETKTARRRWHKFMSRITVALLKAGITVPEHYEDENGE